jgi:hypothetical protein
MKIMQIFISVDREGKTAAQRDFYVQAYFVLSYLYNLESILRKLIGYCPCTQTLATIASPDKDATPNQKSLIL